MMQLKVGGSYGKRALCLMGKQRGGDLASLIYWEQLAEWWFYKSEPTPTTVCGLLKYAVIAPGLMLQATL